MIDLDILDIAATWSAWDRPIPPSTPRTVRLPSTLRADVALVVQGVRRCGKSTLLRQLVARYGLDPKRCAFLNLEDPRLARAQSWEVLEQLRAAFRARHGEGRLTFFLDEVQGVDGWERWLRSQLDREGEDAFVVTGSNARLLSGELASTLTGRHLRVELYPFDLAEARVHSTGTTLEQWLHGGGFPAAIGDADGDMLLRQYLHDIVERDIRERVGARSSRTLLQVVQMVMESAGSELSLRRIAGAVGVAVETVAVYLEACEAAYLLFGVPYFARSERKRAARQRKYYPIDTALRRVTVTRTGADRGKALECATHLALRRELGQVSYWRGAGEVDFVVLRDGVPVPVQVTWGAPESRHERALDAFYEAHPDAAEAIFVTAESFGEGEGVRPP